MVRVALTGANGFLGWHTRCAAHSQGIPIESVAVGNRFDVDAAVAAVSGADRVIHIAGVNRADPEQVRGGNLRFAQQLSDALMRADTPPASVVFANSIQAGNGTPYGESKEAASELLRTAADSVGADYVDVGLPNLFGEHGRPFYNSVVATFCHELASGNRPAVDEDRELRLLHAQNAADALLGVADTDALTVAEHRETVSGLLDRLNRIASTYSTDGEIPDISHPFDRDLFNTFRTAAFSLEPLVPLRRNTDVRGSFFEIVRSAGGPGQSSFSTTVSGVTRGQHYHRRKVERFTVLSGEAVIALRRMFTSEIVELRVTGDEPASVDMPTMWAHNITNVGDDDLYTSFWANELFDPERPDTIAEAV
jgi:dTDP-4-dehydrorhamnose 3,5-epimerase and related enzymes